MDTEEGITCVEWWKQAYKPLKADGLVMVLKSLEDLFNESIHEDTEREYADAYEAVEQLLIERGYYE